MARRPWRTFDQLDDDERELVRRWFAEGNPGRNVAKLAATLRCYAGSFVIAAERLGWKTPAKTSCFDPPSPRVPRWVTDYQRWQDWKARRPPPKPKPKPNPAPPPQQRTDLPEGPAEVLERLQDAEYAADRFVHYRPWLRHLRDDLEAVALVAEVDRGLADRPRRNAIIRAMYAYVVAEGLGRATSIDQEHGPGGLMLRDILAF